VTQESDNGNYLKEGVALSRRCVSAYMIDDPIVMFNEVKGETNVPRLQAAVVYLSSAYGRLIKSTVTNPDESWTEFLLSVYEEEEANDE